MRAHAGWLLAVLVFVASLTWLGKDVRVGRGGDDFPAFHIDEAHKLGEAYFFDLFFRQHDLHDPAWSSDFYARTNPPVAKYIFGAALALTGHPARDRQPQNDFEAHWRSPETLRSLIPDSQLRVTRFVSLLFGAGVCMLLFVIGRRAAGLAAGLIAVVLVLGNTPFVQTAQRGLTDTILLFHLTLIVPVTLWAVGVLQRYGRAELTGGKVRRWLVLVGSAVLLPGLTVALATGSKLNGWLTGPSYAAGLVLAALATQGDFPLWRRVGLAIGSSLLAGLTAVAIFVGINPYFHHNTLERMVDTLKVWDDWMVSQQVCPGPGLFTLHERITVVGFYCLQAMTLPLARVGWTVHASWAGTWLTVLGFTFGVVYLAGRCIARPQLPAEGDTATGPAAERRARLDCIVIASWVIVCSVGVTLWLQVLWDRHMLPVHLTLGLVTAIGLGTLPGALWRIMRSIGGGEGARATLYPAAGVLAAIALWGVLTFTPWIISPMLLPDAMAWSVPEGIDGKTESHVVHGNIGAMFLQLGMHKPAIEQFEAALSLLDGMSDGTSKWVQRCCLLTELAKARAAFGDRAGAEEAVRAYITAVAQVRDRMKSHDAYVRSAYDYRITEAKAQMTQLASTQPAE